MSDSTTRYGVHFPAFLAAAIMLCSCGPIWRSPASYLDYPDVALSHPIMTSEDYGTIIATHPRPCVLHYENAAGGVLLFGAEHTSKNSRHSRIIPA